jgi:hypothetical protein
MVDVCVCVCVCVLCVCVYVHGPISGLPSETAQCRQLLPVLSHIITCRWLSCTHTLHTHTTHTHRQTDRDRDRDRDSKRDRQRNRHTFMEATYTNRVKSIQQNHANKTMQSLPVCNIIRAHMRIKCHTFNGCRYACV